MRYCGDLRAFNAWILVQGPVLSLDVRPGPVGEGEAAVLLVTCMDGSHALVSAAFEGPDRLKLDIIHQAKASCTSRGGSVGTRPGHLMSRAVFLCMRM